MALLRVNSSLTQKDIKVSSQSFAGSVLYMKRLIPITITNILCNRINFDEQLFTKHKMLDAPYKTISSKIPKNHILFSVYHWMQDVLISLEKQYLQQFCLIIQNKENETIVELYNFSVTYNDIQNKNMPTGMKVVQETAKFFHSLNILAEHEKLDWKDLKFALQMVLKQETPDGYITPNFEPKDPLVNPLIDNSVLVCSVSTGYHKLKINADGDIFKLTDDEFEEDEDSTLLNIESHNLNNNNEYELMGISEEFTLKEHHLPKTKELEYNDIENKDKDECDDFKILAINEGFNEDKMNATFNQVPSELAPSISDVSAISVSTSSDFEDSHGNNIVCMCDIKTTFSTIKLIQCKLCKTDQHMPCCGYKTGRSMPSGYTCYTCSIKNGTPPMDSRMKSLKSDRMRSYYAQVRLIGVYCLNTKKSPELIIQKIPATVQKATIKYMEKLNLIERLNGRYETTSKMQHILDQHQYYYSETLVQGPLKKQKINL